MKQAKSMVDALNLASEDVKEFAESLKDAGLNPAAGQEERVGTEARPKATESDQQVLTSKEPQSQHGESGAQVLKP